MIQEYSFSTAVAAGCKCQLAAMDWTRQSGGAVNIGESTMIVPDTLTATAYYDPTATTLRLVGSLSLKSPYDVVLKFTDSQNVNSSPQSATVRVEFSFAPLVFFDTGTQLLNNGALQFIPPAISVAGLYTISFGKKRLSGVFNYPLQFQTCLAQITNITTASLSIGQTQSTHDFPGPLIARLTAPTGMNFDLVGGINDGTYGSFWSVGAVTAQAL